MSGMGDSGGELGRIGLVLTAAWLLQGCVVSRWLSSGDEVKLPVEPEAMELRLADEAQGPNGQVDHYAVLIGANTELRHRGNLSMAYQVLMEQGYQRDKVYVLDSEGRSDFVPVAEVTTRAALHLLFAHLKRVVEPHDTLFIYVTGHGRRVTAEMDGEGERSKIGVSTVLLNPREEMSDWEFGELLDGIEPEAGIAFFDQCYGEVFATTTRSCNFVFITTAAEDETSYGVSFPRAFWGAFRRPAPQPAPSVLEAYQLARANDKGTRIGANRPSLRRSCVDPARLTLLGALQPAPTVLSASLEEGAGAARE